MNNRSAAIFLGLFLSLAAWCLFAADKLRLDDVVYLDDFMSKPIELKALKATPLTFSRDGNGVIDTIGARQSVRLIGIGPERYLVQARVTNGRAEGWVLPSSMEPIPESLLKDIEKKSAAAEKVKEAISRGEIEIGMTEEDVIKILGTTREKSQVKDINGSFDQWTYTTYKKVAYTVQSLVNGTNSWTTTLFRNVPVGHKIVSFQDKKVVRFENKQDDPNQKQQRGQTIVPPIEVQ